MRDYFLKSKVGKAFSGGLTALVLGGVLAKDVNAATTIEEHSWCNVKAGNEMGLDAGDYCGADYNPRLDDCNNNCSGKATARGISSEMEIALKDPNSNPGTIYQPGIYDSYTHYYKEEDYMK